MANKFYINLYKVIKHSRFRKYLLNKIASREGSMMYSSSVRKLYKDIHGIEIGYGSYGGCFNLNNIPRNTSFGNYCSIATDIHVFRANHPADVFTTHPLLYNPVAGYVMDDQLVRPSLVVGHDVWIGQNVIILPSVNKIGNGAIIGAGSIVTKDVEPYSVNVGNPAKKIKIRFKEEVIEELEKSKWWELRKNELIEIIPQLNEIVNNTF